MKKKNLKELVNFNNKPFEKNYCNGEGDIPTKYVCNNNIVLLAVHSINHYEKDKDKWADLNTGGIVKTIEQLTKCSTIINYKKDRSMNPYYGKCNADISLKKHSIKHKKNVVLDIHGAKNNIYFDITIGLGYYKTNPEQKKIIKVLKEEAKRQRIKLKINHPGYRGKSKVRMTKRSLLMGNKGSLQIEITKEYRTKKVERTIKFFQKVINNLSN